VCAIAEEEGRVSEGERERERERLTERESLRTHPILPRLRLPSFEATLLLILLLLRLLLVATF
jgi:hypothetical protein